MARKRMDRSAFMQYVLPTLTKKFGADTDRLNAYVKNSFSLRDDDGSAMELIIHKMPRDGDDLDLNNEEVVTKAVGDALAQLSKDNPMRRKILEAGTPSAGAVPAVARRPIKNFKGTDAERKAFQFGAWALASLGNAKALGWCEDHNIPLTKSAGQLEGTNFLGGYLVPQILETAIIDLRLEYGVFRKNAFTLPMRSDLHHRTRRTGGLTAHFVGEAAPGTKSVKSWNQVNLSAKKIMTLAIVSSELSEDAVIEVGDDLAGEIVYAFSQTEDQCGFLGDGTSTFGGIQGVIPRLLAINGVDDGGGLVLGAGNEWSELILADFHRTVARCPSYARRGAAWFVSPTFDDAVMQRLITHVGGVTAHDVTEGARPRFLGYPVVRAEVMPVAQADSQVCALFGDLSQSSTFGDRRETTIAFATSGLVDGIDLFSTDQIGIRGTQRFDIVNHDLGTATEAGPVVGLITAAS